MKLGTRLGPYEIMGMLGAGGMGEVYRARDTRLGREVAIKILPPEFAQDKDLKARFEREARTISSISDAHICALYDIGEAELEPGSGDTASYIVMEYLRGESLADRIARGPLPMDEVLGYGAEIASALSTAHRHGIIHRDLKPGNVMITPSGAKLLDFGLAKATPDGVNSANEMPTAPITRAGMVVGTLQYMAPEQLEGKEADARTDIFSLGVVLYEMAAGCRAFAGSSPASLASSILRDEPKPLRESKPRAPRAFDRVVRRCMAKDPEQRWQSSTDVAAELREIRDDLSSGRLDADFTENPRTRGTVRQTVIRASLIVVIVAVIAIVASLVMKLKAPATTSAPRIAVEPLTSQPGIDWFPDLSPDGKWVVYAGTADGYRHIFLQSVSGSRPVDLTEDSSADNDQPAFSADGERIAFRSSREGGGIFVMGRTGEAARRLTHEGFRPTWSPDGKQIAYTTQNVELTPQNVDAASELWTVPTDGGEPTRLLEADAVLAAWSPNGHRIAYTSRTGNPFQVDIRSIPAGGGEAVAITSDASTDWSPAWSPDGKFVYFVSDRGGSMNLWRVAADEKSGIVSGEPEPVTVPATTLAHPSLSGDGTRIAYTSAQVTINIQRLALDRETLQPIDDPFWVTTGSRRWSSPDPSPDGEWVTFYSQTQPEGDVYVARRDGTGFRQLTGDDAVDRVPRWSPDGDWIAFFSTRAGPLDIWKVHTDGSGLQRLTEGGGTMVAWSPDAKRIATTPYHLERRTAVFDAARPWGEQKADLLPPRRDQDPPFIVNSWSPDGRRLAGSTGFGKDSKGIVVFDFETGTYETLTDFGEWPVWLPDNQRVMFVADGKTFHVVDTRSGDVRQIYSVASDIIGPPRLSSRGEIFYSRRVTETEVWMATLE